MGICKEKGWLITKTIAYQTLYNYLVETFAKRTGDFTSLSFPDKELIAAAITHMQNTGKSGMIREEPPELTEFIPKDSQEAEEYGDDDDYEDEEEEEENNENKEESNADDDGFITVTKGSKKKATVDEEILNKKNVVVVDKKDTEDEKKKEEDAQNHFVGEAKPVDLEKLQAEAEANEEKEAKKTEENKANGANTESRVNGIQDEKVEDGDSDSDDGKGWINPNNVQRMMFGGTKKENIIEKAGVAVMTADYAMQVRKRE